MKDSKLEEVFERLDNHIEKKLEKEDITRLEAITNALYEVEADENIDVLRKAFQFTYLKQTQIEKVQPNHQLTPDSIGYIIAYIIGKFHSETISVLDIGSGTGHLSMTLYEHLSNIELSGVEIDYDLAEVNVALCEFLKVPMNIYPQNALDDLLIDTQDVVVSDLPIGFYPVPVEGYKTAFSEGRNFAHLLLIEKAMRHIKDNGIGIFIVPSNILEKDNETIKRYLQEDVSLRMFLNLPESVFKSKSLQKSIMVLQKGHERSSKDVLIGEVPTLKNVEGIKNFLHEIDAWYDNFIAQ